MALSRTLNSQHIVYHEPSYVRYGGVISPDSNPRRNDVGLPVVLKENPSKSDLTKTPSIASGVPSIINPYALLAFPTLGSQYNQIVDNPYSPDKFSSSVANVATANGNTNVEPTVFNLVNIPPDGADDAWVSKMPYRYTDFLYCKYYNVIPNNHLITLRRYPAPAYDNLGVPLTSEDAKGAWQSMNKGKFMPIAQAVTWSGEETENKMSDIMGFEVSMIWKEFEANVENVHGNEQQSADGPGIFEGVANILTAVSGTITGNKASANEQQNAQYDPYANGPYSHRVYGPVNVISKTYKRDRGLDFKQSFNINFHYSLKSIGNINPKAAMLDIMSNMLQLTYNNAAFWGGANRYFPNRPVYPFLGGPGGMNSWYRGDPAGFVHSVGAQISKVANEVAGFFNDLFKDPVAALKQLATNGASMAMATLGRGKAPDIVGMKALLTGEPIGEWHMVVGNPYAPTMMIGNLICKGAKFVFNDTLGADNFPTELKVTINMEHGRPRDKGDIESMFNMGEGRIYYAPMHNGNHFNSSSMYDSKNDTGPQGGQPRATLANNQIEDIPEHKSVKRNTSSRKNSKNGDWIGYLGMTYRPGSGDFDAIKTETSDTFHHLASAMGLESAHVKQGAGGTYGNKTKPKP